MILSKVDRAAGGLAVDLGLYALSAVFAGITAATSTLVPHRAWGSVAVVGYAAATVAVLVQWALHRAGTRVRAVVTAATWAAVAWLPMVIQAVSRADGRTDRAQEEVVVVEQAGQRLVDSGTPYLSNDAIAALPADERLLGYVPYQPGMSLFGLPRAATGDIWWTDSRIWFALATLAALAETARLLRDAGPATLRAMQAATVFPVCALTMATGGDDLPVLALCLLALALCAVDRYGGAGLAVGAAAALKLFAWPVAAVLLVHAATRGRPVLTRFAVGAVGLPVLALVPAALVDPRALYDNVVGFPLGHGVVSSPAASPFPGHLIANNLPGGRVIAAVLLVGTAVAIGGWLLRRPPRSASAAALVAAWGLLAAILLMPSTRFGYVLYPVALFALVPAVRTRSRVPA